MPISDSASYPRLFGNYVLVAPLARGGMGELHLALSGQAELRKLCVIKQIIGHLADQEFVRRFVDEAKLVVKFSHGNLVPVFESGVHDGHYFLVMEFIEGRDLRAIWNRIVAEKESFPLEVSLLVVRELCRALSYAHTYGDLQLVHRDINPPNILLSESGEVRLTDFGLAQSQLKIQKTAPGVLFGKLAYMAPEQARNEAVSPRTDIFALGVILWELLTGKRLFAPEGTQLERLQRAAHPTIERPSKTNPTLPPALDLICRRALAVDPKDRYPNAEAMRSDIAGLLAQIAPTADASHISRFLEKTYGDELSQEREERHAMLDAMGPAIAALYEETDVQRREKAPTQRFIEAETEIAPPLDFTETDQGDQPQAPQLAPGTVLSDRYRIEAMIREGGMGTVYLATHLGIEKKVAVKVLHPIYSKMPEVVTRFRREARAASRIGHPNIIEIFDSGETAEGAIYFAMEHLVGQDLGDLLSAMGHLSVDRTMHIAMQICQAVSAAHAEGIVHRDLKPENVFLVPREGQLDFVKVLDFGIAQSTHLEESRRERLTHPGMAMGTPEYMAPEQAAGQGCDHRADIYAVGAILYEMLAGSPPHQGSNMLEILTKKATEDVVPLVEVRSDIPAALQRAVMWALAREPQNRPQVLSHLSYELTKLTSGRAGAVASMLGLTDLAPKVSPVQDEETHETDINAADALPGGIGHRDTTIDAVSTGSVGFSTESVPALRERRKKSWVRFVPPVVVLLMAWIIAGAYYLGARRSDSHQDTPVQGTPSPQKSAASPTKQAVPPVVLPKATASDTTSPVAPTVAPASQPKTAARIAHLPAGVKLASRPRKKRRYRRGSLVRARALLKQGSFTKARTAFQAARHRPATRARALLGLAEIAFQQRQLKEAERFAKAAARAGAGWRANLALGNIYFKQARVALAAKMYRRVLRRRPGNKEARRNLDAALRRIKR